MSEFSHESVEVQFVKFKLSAGALLVELLTTANLLDFTKTKLSSINRRKLIEP